MEPILSVRELTKTFSRPGQGKQTAVNGVSFDLRPGERLGIIGESGSGKTTVANLVTRLLDADGGRILLDGEDITSVTGRTCAGCTGRYRWCSRPRRSPSTPAAP